MKILIADQLSDKAVNILTTQGFTVDIKTGLSPDTLKEIIGTYDGLIVRSATKVTKDIINKADNLKVIGRAGIGVDNVDVVAATEKGIIVMNTPQGNALAAAEHTLALMFAAARKIAIADRTMKEGKWEKKAFVGIEIYEKALGVIGIGNIGLIVAEKALALGMQVIAYDPYIPRDFAERKGITLVDFDTLLKESDFITIHVPLVKDTRNLINKDALDKMKKGVIIINAARGPIVNEKDLYEALESGQVACAALDVFEQEPPPKDNPLILSDKTVCTPHLGASTREAQDKVAIDIANQMVDFFVNGVIKNSVNAPSVSKEVARKIKPYLSLSEKLGTVVSAISDFPVEEIDIQYMGGISETDTRVLTQAIIKSVLSQRMEGINYVNAPAVAKSREIKVKETKMDEHEDFTSLLTITLRGGGNENTVYGTLFGKKEPRLVKIKNIFLEADLGEHMLFVYNYDKPGVIAGISNVFFLKGINIGDMHFGRESAGGLAISLLEVDVKIDDSIIKEIQGLPNIISAKKIDLP
ncbi:MAG TPA: phosphoglycerate dehydrogenase [Deltaproteobacteria bacterium]|nr:phosphoglycerate dehydrogenase [Deltaproteobacteria bacterium]